jgi:hypothetical protein
MSSSRTNGHSTAFHRTPSQFQAPTRPQKNRRQSCTSRAWRWRRRLRSSLTMRWSSTGRRRLPGLAAHSSISGTRSVPGWPSGYSEDCRPSGRAGLGLSVLYWQGYAVPTRGRRPVRSLLLPQPKRSRRRVATKREAIAWWGSVSGDCLCTSKRPKNDSASTAHLVSRRPIRLGPL